MPLYTHLQKAQLGVFSHYINYYLSQLLRVEDRIEDTYKRINKNPLGACAIGGTSININRKRTTELLGFDGLVQNSIDAVSSRDYLLETLMILSLLATHLSRISEDLMIWSTREFRFIDLDDKFCSVSSVMPQKKNPDTLELSRAKSSIIISNTSKASLIIKAIPSGYFRDFQELQPLLKESINLTKSTLHIFTGIFSTIKINKDRMLNQIRDSYILALDLAEILVNDYNVPFRNAHSIIGKLISDSSSSEDLFNIQKIEKLIENLTGKKLNISPELLKQLKNNESTLNKRKSKGSPSHREVLENINLLRKEKEKLYEKYRSRIESLRKADSLRERTIRKIIS
jgi:argininosuccinate lyase